MTAFTRRIATDEAIIQATRQASPTLVSMDCPLSLPTGRLTPYDDDPTRHTHGITRACERALRKRGIGVYPCLLPSMQKMTERGMRLAERLRALGLPVIESYPGGAQDILGIPRKRAGVEALRQGLLQFGVRGAFAEAPVSHDELDAITAALVGLFYQSQRYEALGDPQEGVLIVPIRTRPDRK